MGAWSGEQDRAGPALRSDGSIPTCARCGTRRAADQPATLCSPCQVPGARATVDHPPVLPPELWDTEALETAFAARHMGRVLRAYRAHPQHRSRYGPRGIPQSALAGWLGLTQAQVSRIETGTPVTDLPSLIHYARVLGMPPGRLWFSLPGADAEPKPSGPALPADVAASQTQWRVVRRYLNAHRSELAARAGKLYAPEAALLDTPLLAHATWTPMRPVPLERVRLAWAQRPTVPLVDGTGAEAAPALPLHRSGSSFERYTQAVRYIDSPKLFENRPSYRLTGVTWETSRWPHRARHAWLLPGSIVTCCSGRRFAKARRTRSAVSNAPVADEQPRPDNGHEQWRQIRRFLNESRFALTQRLLAERPPAHLMPGTPLLARSAWIPSEPVPLEQVRLRWQDETPTAVITAGEPELDHVRPRRTDDTPYRLYADAVRDLAKPRLFENRGCYRLLGVEVASDGPTLTFGRGQYFDVMNICEAAAHEYAAAAMSAPESVSADATPFRNAIADPTDLGRRPVMAATSTLVIRHDRQDDTAEFVLHWRDPEKVASGGGLYQVMPVGMFQASADAPWNEANDFDLWRAILRELSEELLGESEDYGSDQLPIDYDAWPLNKTLTAAREAGTLRLFWLGLGMDPLTYVTDMLTVAAFDAELFDETFQQMTTSNAEGHRVGTEDGTGRSMGIPFTAAQVDRLTSSEPMQPAGAALLSLAWHHREVLLGNQSRGSSF